MYIALLLLALTSDATGLVKTITPGFKTGSGTYNAGEDVVLECGIQLERTPSLNFHQEWHKKQDGGFVLVGSNDNKLVAPFTSGKYEVGFSLDEDTNEVIFKLSISGVESVDTGDYRCSVGNKNLEQTESTILSLNITPELDSSSSPSFNTDASSDKDVRLFNEKHNITCEAGAISRSDQLSLTIKNGDGTDLTTGFYLDESLSWSGAEGLKLPKKYVKLNGVWMPDMPGAGELLCYFKDGDRELIVQKFKYRQDVIETPEIACSTNYKVPVEEGNLDLYITCVLSDYSSDVSNLHAKWTFLYEKEDVKLFTGETKHLRSARQNGKKFILFIPKITREMTTYGKIFNYHLTLRENDDETVASHTFGLPTNTAGKVTNKATRYICSVTTLLFTSLLLLL